MDSNDNKIGFFQILLLVLSIFVIAAVVLDGVARIPPAASRLLQSVDLAVCGLFLVDFGVRFRRSPDKLSFMRWGWIDLIASVPNLDILRWGRLVRVIRILRVLRGVRSIQKVWRGLLKNKTRTGAASLTTTFVLLVVCSSVAILVAEDDPSSNIKTVEDAIWWSVSTMTTVGYGDRFPITTEGRVIAMGLMVCGIGLFGAVSGLTASLFLGQKAEPQASVEDVLAEIQQLRGQLNEMRNKDSEASKRT